VTKNTYSLVLDTSLGFTSLSLWNQSKVECVEYFFSQKQGENLQSLRMFMYRLRQMVPDAFQYLDRLIVGHGPGSFTGIKICVAFAYGLVAGSQRIFSSVKGVDMLVLIARYLASSMSEHQALFFPSTRTHGYVAVPVENRYKSYLFSFQNGLYLEGSRYLGIEKSLHLLKKFSQRCLVFKNESFFHTLCHLSPSTRIAKLQVDNLKNQVLLSIKSAIKEKTIEENQQIYPHYCRLSTAEEKILISENK